MPRYHEEQTSGSVKLYASLSGCEKEEERSMDLEGHPECSLCRQKQGRCQ